jgi:hypothetical protein
MLLHLRLRASRGREGFLLCWQAAGHFQVPLCCCRPPLKPIGYTWSYLACGIRHSVPIWQPIIGSSAPTTGALPLVTNRIHLVPFGMQNRTFGPYLAAINRILPGAGVQARAGEQYGAVGRPSGGLQSRLPRAVGLPCIEMLLTGGVELPAAVAGVKGAGVLAQLLQSATPNMRRSVATNGATAFSL